MTLAHRTVQNRRRNHRFMEKTVQAVYKDGVLRPLEGGDISGRGSKDKGLPARVRRQENFYLSAANDLLRHPDDQPSIGIILRKTRERFLAEYALRDINEPIGISEYRLAESLPEKLQGSPPTIEELENELGAASEGESQPEK
jgi:nuclease YhcG-like protein